MTFLLCTAALMQAAWLFSLRATPWRENVPAFLAWFAGAFVIYIVSWKYISKEKRPKNSGPVLFFILLSGILFRATVSFSPPSLSDDIYRYLWDGRVQLAGINPYEHAPESPELAPLRDENFAGINHKNIRTIYPPLSQIVFRLAAKLSPALLTQRLCFMAFDFALLFMLPFYLERKGRPTENVLIYAWNPLILVEFSSSGHLDAMGLFFLFAGLFVADLARPRLAGIGWGLSFLSKLAALPMIPWMIIKRGMRNALIPFAATIGLGYAAYIALPMLELKKSLFSGTAAYTRDWYFNAGLYALLSSVTQFRGLYLKIGIISLATAISILLARRLKKNQLLAYTSLIWAVMFSLSPVVHPWYAVWLVPFLCFYPWMSGLAFTGLVSLSYWVLIGYRATGQWELPLWVPWVEYGITYALLAFDIRKELGVKTTSLAENFEPFAVRAAVIIPALNEEKALPSVLSEISPNEAEWVIVVDNGSTDRTPEVAAAAGAKVVKETRRGYGQAVLTGIAALPPECNTVVVMDGDHSDYPEDLKDLLAPLRLGKTDFVIGSRVLGGAPPESLTPQQRFGNWLSCLLIRILFGRKFTDLGPFRAIRRDVLDNFRMEDPTFGWNVEMQIKAVRSGARTMELPVRYRARIGVSKISGTLKGSFWAGVKILSTIFYYGLWVIDEKIDDGSMANNRPKW